MLPFPAHLEKLQEVRRPLAGVLGVLTTMAEEDIGIREKVNLVSIRGKRKLEKSITRLGLGAIVVSQSVNE